jgi:hypothetical protein
MRDLDSIGSEPQLVADLRCAARKRGGPLPSIDVADALLDERRELTGLSPPDQLSRQSLTGTTPAPLGIGCGAQRRRLRVRKLASLPLFQSIPLSRTRFTAVQTRFLTARSEFVNSS